MSAAGVRGTRGNQETTYLELSQDDGSAHKFYEVTVDGTAVLVRYGRIGADGQRQTSAFPTEEKAKAAAAKKIGEKVRKGYAPAVRGQRAARSVTRRQVTSAPSTARATAPVLWRFRTGATALGIHIEEDRCWVGNQNGDVYTLGHDGEVLARYRLPEGVKCLVADDFWIYAGCDDGRVYDLSSKMPFAAYEIAEDVDIFWLDIHEGVLNVADRNGGLTVIDHEDEFQWSRRSTGGSAWMVRSDEEAVYHGHTRGVTAYASDGSGELWHTATTGNVLFGWQEDTAVYAGTGRHVVQRMSKATGRIEATYRCDGAVYSCATSPGGRYVFAGDSSSSVYCFDADGTRLWKLRTGSGSALSMQYRDEKLYIVTTDGSLACIDASETAIAAAQSGSVPVAVDVKQAAALPTYEPTATVATVSSQPAPGSGVVVECVQGAGGRLRVHVVSDGYEPSWNVQFPRSIRQVGARYVVDALHSSQGGFYRVRGEIKRLV
ncbi:molybdenum metabolism regulator [Streptomyces agglomeratus]|uniref:Molybdenum metabolism regulator n=1 Tax=Streptomyces agglomeratus TaxID=285458 RepID=A0A1E5PDE5_9ACTN|nr:WGR domain-containing protein [Streptomyces agglomeratus]OEJ27404.1 molybdenum metabolism regulator [Streptomyces agglomeratus]OEJ38541.1 molybdenum metabolism regulator [Streptomyces agglomeratus]OEJ47075.1 molybdenum metabolism regulator [Streptomyces agglomeratus]OEJ51069.1 molybdenum metabolism regulator [Streptomyces agglomeratus]OEJ58439.1 molybdenum metabolism regulator [Streptomyces agglomeratus]